MFRDPKDASYCTAAPGDCLRIKSCDSQVNSSFNHREHRIFESWDDVQADCEFDVKFGADHEHHKCVCKTGWTGNGVQVLPFANVMVVTTS